MKVQQIGQKFYLRKNNMISENIELKAEEILNNLNIKNIPIPIEEIATKMQIKISRAPSKEFSGLLIRKDGRSLIGVNSDEALVRQRFTIAHELGHLFLHPAKDAFVDYRNNKNETHDFDSDQKEKQANRFAAALLMPRKNIIKDYKSLSKNLIEDEICILLSKRYEVSEDAMKYRLKNLGLQFSV